MIRIGRADEVPPLEGRSVTVDGRRIAVFRTPEGFRALDHACPHAGGPLSEGAVRGDTLACPYHGWVWSLRSGACVAPGRDARVVVYPTRVEAGEVWVELP